VDRLALLLVERAGLAGVALAEEDPGPVAVGLGGEQAQGLIVLLEVEVDRRGAAGVARAGEALGQAAHPVLVGGDHHVVLGAQADEDLDRLGVVALLEQPPRVARLGVEGHQRRSPWRAEASSTISSARSTERSRSARASAVTIWCRCRVLR